ncbi:MAG: hypothetical protein E7Z97_05920 [Propionibacteriaceae bacterium]|nr:hypothetical protein [Propionibacteriaceae bacterium]
MSTPQHPGDGDAGQPADWASRPARPADGWWPSPAAAGPGHEPTAAAPASGQGAVTGRAGRPALAVASTGGSRATVVIVAAVLLAMLIAAVTLSTAVNSNEGRARRIVREYLTAVAEEDAEKARGYLSEVDDDSLLTDEVLRVSNELAPMTDISVGRVRHSRYISTDYQVRVSYRIGDETVSTIMDVSLPRQNSSTAVKSAGVASLSSLWLTGFGDIDVTVNGVIPDTNRPAVFPGNYKIAASNEYLEITGDPIAATDPSEHSYSAAAAGNELAVSEAGVQMFRDKVIAAARECLASTKLSPGCGTKVPQYPNNNPRCEEVREDSVHRRQEPEEAAKLESFTPKLKAGAPMTITAGPTDLGYFTPTATCRTGDTWTEQQLYGPTEATRFSAPSIDLTDPDLALAWEG